FPTPLPQSPRSDILEWRFPKPYHNLTLTGRSRAAWHTSFVIPQLNLLLDAGLVVNNLRPKHIFLTHGHSDHTLLTPAFVKRSDPPDIFCPAEMKDALDGFINAKTMLSEGGGIWPPESNATATKPPPPLHPLLRTHTTHGLHPGTTVTLRHLSPPPTYTATAFACDHTVPCLGYLFSAVTPKLQPQYRGLPGAELRRLREEEGVAITAPAAAPVLAFLGDGTAATLRDRPETVGLDRGVAVVVTECSFLWEEHRAQAERTRHTLWSDLEPVVRRWPRTVFVLVHFSLRYSDEEIRRFFRGREGLGNVVVWVDGRGDGEGEGK
ncbi:uncharacterized protein THITE_15187, partial [Thermothielavioides terrestris NRRL 8126]